MKAWLVVLCAAACESGEATQPAPAPAPHGSGSATVAVDTSEGATLYKTLCVQCHGADLKGYKSDHAPSLINPTFLDSATDAYLFRAVEVGRPGTAMPGYGKTIGGPLDAKSIDTLVAWLRGHGPKAAPLPRGEVTGDAARGQAVYAKACQKCHGDRDQRGEFVHLANARFLEIASDPFVRRAIAAGRPGTPMEAFEGKLTEREIDDVVVFVRSLARPSTFGELPAPTGKEPLFVNPKGKPPELKLRAETCVQPCDDTPRFAAVDDVKKALDQGRKMVIVDARPASDWMHVHVTGAVSIPYHDMKRLEEIPKDAWVVAYCACPHHLSGIIVDELRKRGYKHAVVLDEGILEWQRRGYPIVAAAGAEVPPKEPELPPGTIR